MGSLVEGTVNLNLSVYIELLENQVLPFVHDLIKKHNIPIRVFKDYSSYDARTANATDWHDEHS